MTEIQKHRADEMTPVERKKAIEENKLVSPTNEEAWSENYQRLVKKITSQ